MSAFLFRFREPLSAANAAILLLLLSALSNAVVPLTKPSVANAPAIELKIVMPDDLAFPEHLPVQPPPVSTRAVRHESAKPAPLADASEVAQHVGNAGDGVAQPAPVPAIQLPSPPGENVAMTMPAKPVPIVTAPPANVGREAEAAYVGKVRAYLQGIKRYPTGREASLQRPSGVAVIGFTLRRSGELLDAVVEGTSGSMLLDSTALATVRRGSYPAFPEDAWVGKMQQHFSVELDFLPK